MSKVWQLKNKDNLTGKIKDAGKLEIRNQTEDKADLYLLGDIVSDSWQSYWYDEDKCPQDISDFLKDIENTKDINIYINSGGGSVHAGIAIYNMLKRHKGFKTVYVDGIAASIASVIAMAGDKIVIPSNAQLMIHKPSSWGSGDAESFRKLADILDTCQESITSIYMDNIKEGITKEQITDMINVETWFTGSEAANYFNIEVDEQSEIVACSSDFYNKYKNIPNTIKDSIDKNKNDSVENMDEEIEIMRLKLELI